MASTLMRTAEIRSTIPTYSTQTILPESGFSAVTSGEASHRDRLRRDITAHLSMMTEGHTSYFIPEQPAETKATMLRFISSF